MTGDKRFNAKLLAAVMFGVWLLGVWLHSILSRQQFYGSGNSYIDCNLVITLHKNKKAVTAAKTFMVQPKTFPHTTL